MELYLEIEFSETCKASVRKYPEYVMLEMIVKIFTI